jgi:leucyl aminopeptidase
MISVQLANKGFWQTEAEGYIVLLKHNLEPLAKDATLQHIENTYYPNLKQILKKHQFEGEKSQSFVLTSEHNGALVQFIFVGVGKLDGRWDNELEALRRAIGSGIQTMRSLKISSGVIALPDNAIPKFSAHELLKQIVIVAHMASYSFTTFKSDKKKHPWSGVLNIATTEDNAAAIIEQGNIIGTAINQARHWSDMPANHMTPSVLAAEAAAIGQKHNFKTTIFGREKALELGMGAFCSVDAGSEQDGKFVVLEYKTDKQNAPTIALCGKGVMFDTGGINLKPTSGISGMKFDMSGAAAVITIMDIIGQLKPQVNVIGLTPLVENMPSGKASRPDDVVTCMNGKTVEIQNTDAEGRLILSDTLCYAEKFFSPDIIIDIATLTGAVQHALGHFYTAVMTKDEKLASELLAIGRITGDRTWELPLEDDFKGAIRSEVADIHNNGSSAYYGGTIVGGYFLSHFVEKARWAHLDIAGTAHDVPGINYVGKGSTGAGIRLLTEFILKHNN